MILKRPQGSVPEAPEMLRQRLQRSWPARVRDHLSLEGEEPNAWPLEVNIGRPKLTGDALIENVLKIREWIDAWRAVDGTNDVHFFEKTRRRGAAIQMPEKIIFSDIDCLAEFLGADALSALATARSRFDDLKVIDPRLSGMAHNWRTITEMSEAEHEGACDFLQQRKYDNPEDLSIREMMLASVNGKFLEKRRSIIEDALGHMDKIKEGRDYRERLGFRYDDRQTLWIKANPQDMSGPFGARQFAVRPSDLTAFPDTIRQVTIVENIETFFSYDPEPGVFLFFGSGNAMSGMAPEIHALQNLPVVYWGDLDSFGMKILSRIRRWVRHTTSVMMDGDTMNGIAREAWREEPKKDRYTGYIGLLTDPEQAALDQIRSGNYRIEQEHLRPGPEQLVTLGLQRTSSSLAA